MKAIFYYKIVCLHGLLSILSSIFLTMTQPEVQPAVGMLLLLRTRSSKTISRDQSGNIGVIAKTWVKALNKAGQGN